MAKLRRGAKIFIIVLAALIVLILINVLLPSAPEDFSKTPSDWVVPSLELVGDVEVDAITIDIIEATAGESYWDGSSQFYNSDDVYTRFSTIGMYNGEEFRTLLVKNNKTLVRVGPNFNPTDGVIDVLILEKFNDGKAYTLIFVDEDFKNIIGNANILWGKGYTNLRRYVFTEISEGIYMDQVEDDMSRFVFDDQAPVQMLDGLIFGQIDKEEINNFPPPLDVFFVKQI